MQREPCDVVVSDVNIPTHVLTVGARIDRRRGEQQQQGQTPSGVITYTSQLSAVR